MTLPRLLLIGDRFTEPERAERLVEAVRAGVCWVMLRDHTASDEVYLEAATVLAAKLRAEVPDVLLTINRRISVARRLNTGFHTGAVGPGIAEARRVLGEAPIGFSAHSSAEAALSRAAGADYAVFSPIFPTLSKPGHSGTGLKALADCCKAVPGFPVFALGGVTPERVSECLNAGAYGVAVLSGILDAPDITMAAVRYLDRAPSKDDSTSRRIP